VITIHTERFIPKRFAATTYGPIILIRPAHRGDKGLLEHEKIHVWQWVWSAGLHGLAYRFSRGYRLAAEVAAYAEQAKHYPDDRRPVFASHIATLYDLDVTEAEALSLLRGNN
jgi:hypothetical protein